MNYGSTPVTIWNSVTNALDANLPYNINQWALQAALRRIPGFQQVEVEQPHASAGYSYTILISYYGYNDVVPPVTASSAFLTGGKLGTVPTATFIELRAYSPNLLVNPIDFNYLSTDAAKANVLVSVNNLQGACVGNCEYTFIINEPVLTALSRANSLLDIQLSTANTLPYTLADTTIIFDGQKCSIVNVAASPSSFQCQLPVNTDSTATIDAGNHLPVISIKNIGLVSKDPSVNSLPFPLSLTSVGPDSGTSNGGYTVLLSGVGFPVNSKSPVTVTICNITQSFSSFSNI